MPYTVEEVFKIYNATFGFDLEALLNKHRKVSLRFKREGKIAVMKHKLTNQIHTRNFVYFSLVSG